ncbi:GNAT family N-acetyltransferase [Kitasatospora aburaviensis]
MTTLTIRDFRADDAEAAAAAHRAGRDHLVLTPEVFTWLNGHQPEGAHYRCLVAELDGRVVGSVRCGVVTGTTTRGVGFANGSVLPEYRRRGAFTALLAAAERHLAEQGVVEVHSWVDEEPGSLAFAAARGYTGGRQAYFGGRDLALPLPEARRRPPAWSCARRATGWPTRTRSSWSRRTLPGTSPVRSRWTPRTTRSS